MNGSQQLLEKAEGELQDVIDAGNAGEETLLGFLRANKPDWAQDIGRIVSEKTLLRSDLTPVLTGGSDLFGVSIDLEQMDAPGLLRKKASSRKSRAYANWSRSAKSSTTRTKPNLVRLRANANWQRMPGTRSRRS